jgi:hypothetical protein
MDGRFRHHCGRSQPPTGRAAYTLIRPLAVPFRQATVVRLETVAENVLLPLATVSACVRRKSPNDCASDRASAAPLHVAGALHVGTVLLRTSDPIGSFDYNPATQPPITASRTLRQSGWTEKVTALPRLSRSRSLPSRTLFLRFADPHPLDEEIKATSRRDQSVRPPGPKHG